jgi:hypothetical protein
MVKHVSANMISGLSALNDAGVITVPLPQVGGIASLELTARATTGAGGSATYTLLDSITKIEIKTIHGQGILEMSATELYRLSTFISREAPQLSQGTGAGAVQVVKLPINFGPDKIGELYGLDMKKYPDCELKVHYDLHIDGGDGFATLTFNIDLDARQTLNMQAPNYQGRMRLYQAKWEPTKVQDPHRIKINYAPKITGLFLWAYKSGTADNALVRNVTLLTNPGEAKEVQASFSDLQERSRPIAGSIIANWLTIWSSPNRNGDKPLVPLNSRDIEIQLEELVADGSIKVFIEDINAS